VIATLLVLALVGLSWTPLFWGAAALLFLAISVPVAQAVRGAMAARFQDHPRSRGALLRMRVRTAWLHLLQPIVRLRGRLATGLSLLRLRGRRSMAWPRPSSFSLWTEHWLEPTALLARLEHIGRAHGALVRRGGNFAGWDLGFDAGLFGGSRLLSTVEEHGSGRQLFRLRAWPVVGRAALLPILLFALLATAAGRAGAWTAAISLTTLVLCLAMRTISECSSSLLSVRNAISTIREQERLS
jgi:hypothetical protein